MAVAQKDLNLRITGDSSSLEQASQRGSRALSKMEREARRLERQQQKTHRAMEEVGRGMLLAGAAIAAGLALSVKAAIDWESAWAGVQKTVDGTDEQMAALEEDIRSLASVLPATHAEIAAVAEAAGQLGIQRENVAGFTKVMIDMGEATNLSATDAATALARMMNIMQTAPEDVSRLGATIVDLGNNAATTEAEIVEMALRIAGAGNQIGFTEADVLAFSSTLSSVGIRAEAGGTAISRVFLEIDDAVRNGGEALDTFAETAGMSATEFQRAYQEDAAGAIATFVQGLGRVQQSGGDVNAILGDLGLDGIRVADSLRRMSGAGDLLTQSLDRSGEAWDENTALLEEAERRYGTTEAKMAIARNQLNDFAIDVGNVLVPAVAGFADGVGSLAELLGNLPGPVKAVLTVIAGLSAALLLVGGAALIAIPRIAATTAALNTLAAGAGRAAAAARGLRTALATTGGFLGGPWGVALAAATILLGVWASKQAEADARADEFSSTLNEQTGAITGNTRAMVANRLEEEGALEAANRLGVSLSELVDIVTAGEDAQRLLEQAVADSSEQFSIHDGVLLRTKDSTDEQARAWVTLNGAVGGMSGELTEAQKQFQRTNEAAEDSGTAMEELDPATRQVAESMGITAEEASGLTSEVEDLDQALNELFGIIFGVEEAQDAAAEAMRRLVEQAKEQGTALKGNSEEALNNRDAIRDVVDADFDVIAAMAEAGATSDELTTKTEKLKQKFIDQMRQAGFSEEAIDRYAAAYDEIPGAVETNIMTPGLNRALDKISRFKAMIGNIDREVQVNVGVTGTGSNQQGMGPGLFARGGEVFGPAGPDLVPIRATAGEFVIRREVAQENAAALRALNSTGRWPVASGAFGGGGGSAAGMGGGGMFEGTLVLDSGEFLGVVRGQLRQHDRGLKRRASAGVGVLR